MSRSSRCVYLLPSLAVALVVNVGSARAGASADSDRLVVTDFASGAVLFDQSIPEPAAAGSETSLFFSPVGGLPPPAAFDPSLTYIALIEPLGAPPEPGGEPPIFLPGTELILSDLVIGSFQSDIFDHGVQLLSDGDPSLPQLIAGIPFGSLIIGEETGDLQDVS